VGNKSCSQFVGGFEDLNQLNTPKTNRAAIDDVSIYKDCAVPVSSDGTWFGPHLARSADKFTLGPKGREIQVAGFENALEILKKLPIAQWRRPNVKGNWGTVIAVGDWKMLNALTNDDGQRTMTQATTQNEIILQETKIGQIYENIKELYAERKIASAIDGEKLAALVNEILSAVLDATDAEKLLAASAFGYLYAAPSVKNRAEIVWDPVKLLFESTPPSLSTLNIEGTENSAERRRRAAEALAHAEGDWLLNYFKISAITEESNSNLPREQLITNVLMLKGDLTGLFEEFRDSISAVKAIDDLEQRFTRVKRFFESLENVVKTWTGDCGEAPGESLSDLFAVAHRTVTEQAKKEDRYDAADSAQRILGRIIQLRFSFAMSADTYGLLRAIQKSMEPGRWADYLNSSTTVAESKNLILEAILVLARQGKEDSAFTELAIGIYGGLPTAKSAVSTHLEDHSDINPEVKNWWAKAGKVSLNRGAAQQRDDITVDHQVGALLIETEDAREAMEKMGRAVVPILKLSNPLLADTTSRASNGYSEISRIARQLSQARKLTVTSNKGKIEEYNRKRHDMLGGHKPGTRKVKVVRNGVIKQFGGTEKIIIKEWVEPAD